MRLETLRQTQVAVSARRAAIVGTKVATGSRESEVQLPRFVCTVSYVLEYNEFEGYVARVPASLLGPSCSLIARCDQPAISMLAAAREAGAACSAREERRTR